MKIKESMTFFIQTQRHGENDIDVFKSIYTAINSNIQKSLDKDLVWIIY